MFFITGVSTSGKTTIIPYLKKLLPVNFSVYDFDQRGVPDNVSENWRKQETRYWLEEGIRDAGQEKTAVVCGISIPSEVEANKDLLENIEPHYALLEVSSLKIEERFRQRLSTKEMQNEWARTTGLSLEESVKQNISFASQLRNICQDYNCKIFDTARFTPEEVARGIANWIKTC